MKLLLMIAVVVATFGAIGFGEATTDAVQVGYALQDNGTRLSAASHGPGAGE